MKIKAFPSYYLLSLGCSKNQVDSEKINGALQSAGFVPAETSEEAEILIVNTCGFIESAKEEAIDVVMDAIAGKEDRFLAVLGCLTERYQQEITKDIPEIDFVYGLADDKFVIKLLDALGISPVHAIQYHQKPLVSGLAYSYLKIAEGCSNNCSYCAIPLIRGPHRPFSPEEILKDAQNAVNGNAKELIVVAQDVGAYSVGMMGLPELVQSVSEIDGVEWIRLMYCHPDHITDSIITLIRDNPRVVPYIDIPFQHVNERILNSMGRKGNVKIYTELVNKLRTEIPGIAIRSTLMLGYPGETDEEFDELLTFIKDVQLDRVGAFTFSPEEGTKAFSLDSQIPFEVAENRLNIFMETQKGISEANLLKRVGTKVQVLIEEQINEHEFIGRSEFDAPEVDGVFYLTGSGAENNHIVQAEITGNLEYDLIGELL